MSVTLTASVTILALFAGLFGLAADNRFVAGGGFIIFGLSVLALGVVLVKGRES